MDNMRCDINGIDMPVELEIGGKEMRFIAFPEKEGGWNCGYVSTDFKTTFVNEEFFTKYDTLEDAAKACRNALQSKGYWPTEQPIRESQTT